VASDVQASVMRGRFGALRWIAVAVRPAIRANDFFILLFHFVQESGKCLTTILTQEINPLFAHKCRTFQTHSTASL
jgi:hypothetical protein